MSLFKKTILLSSLIFGYSAPAVMADEYPSQQITKAHEHTVNQAPASNFSGEANFSRFPTLPSNGDVAPAVVHFEANTITNWHIHPQGQYLIVTEGEGRTQSWGNDIQKLEKGDVVWCPPGVKHWHGASADSPMTHIAISPVSNTGEGVTWLEKVELPAAEQSSPQFKEIAPVELSSKQLSLIPIAGFTATGNIDELKHALVEGLESGLTVNEIKQVFAHQYAYAGFPRALNGMLTFRSLLKERQSEGIDDPQGETPSELPADTDYYQLGSETLSYLNQTSLEQNSKPLFDNFSPTMDHALKSHLFGYLFSRDNLGPLARELVVVSTLSVLEGVNAQLSSHLRISKNLGLDETQMQKVMNKLAETFGEDIAENANTVLHELQ